MKYERIERTLEETIEFLIKNKWSIDVHEKDLLSGHLTVEGYLDNMYNSDKAQQFVDFFFKQVEKFEKGQWCWFYDNDLDDGVLSKYEKCLTNSLCLYVTINGSEWKNCISIKEFRKRLKEYL